VVAGHPTDKALKAHAKPRHDWLETSQEVVVDPDIPIVDPHHHVLDMPTHRYMFEDVLEDFGSGHNVVASVYVQCNSMYRASGPEEMKSVGETEFVNGIAAQSASGKYGPTRVFAGIVGSTDLRLGSAVEPVLEAHIRAGGNRFRGIRPTIVWHEDPDVRPIDIDGHLLVEPKAKEAIKSLERMGLTLDAWAFFTQLEDTLEICRLFPDLTVIVDHTGGPLGFGPYEGRRDEFFGVWRERIETIASCPNAYMKIGGLGMRYAGFNFNTLPQAPSSDMLVQAWKPYVESCVEAFGPSRCMFESNFPIDKGMFSYQVVWNAFKKLSSQYTLEERLRLLGGTAAAAYRLRLD
jgi:predicted TIM-barrel fold metal-dependent hydrolase